MPGVPDFYQGTELFEPTLTDPDNRRPVDYGKRRQLLAALPCFEDPASDRDEVAGDICRNWPDGRLKLLVIRALLHLRRREPRLFDGGSYERLEVAGRHAGHVVALARRDRRRLVVALVPRLVFGLAGPGRFPTGRAVWGDTTLRLPSGADRELVDVITGKAAATRREVLAVGEILEPLPVAVLATAT
jgi:(1->4)-alpha-D-glucan 1-alpha-D-glucosylmutase